MTIKSPLFSALALCLLAATGAQAQTTRAEVKAEAAMARASMPAAGGERSLPSQDQGGKPRASAVSRAEVKADTKAAKATGTATVGGEAGAMTQQGKKPNPRPMSTNSRTEVKADAKMGTMPTNKGGEATQKDQDKGVTKP